jgi:hypothetical protein
VTYSCDQKQPNQLAISPLASQIGDGGLLSTNACAPPCFWGIEPGTTTRDEVSQILSSKGFLENCKSIDKDQSAIVRGVGGWTCESILDITFRTSDEVVDYIGFKVAKPIALEDIITKYGFPDFVLVLNTGLPENPSLHVRIYYTALHIFFPLGGEHTGAEFEIKGTSMVEAAGYLDRRSLEHHFERFQEDLIAWKGYGYYP